MTKQLGLGTEIVDQNGVPIAKVTEISITAKSNTIYEITLSRLCDGYERTEIFPVLSVEINQERKRIVVGLPTM